MSYTCAHAIYICSCGALYRGIEIVIGNPNDTYGWSFIYIIYTTTDTFSDVCIMVTHTHNNFGNYLYQ